MKDHTLLVVFFSVVSFYANAQEDFTNLRSSTEFGVRLISGKMFSNETFYNIARSSGSKIGYSVGVPLKDRIAVSIGGYYSFANIEYYNANEHIWPSVIPNDDKTLLLEKIELPIEILYRPFSWITFGPGLRTSYLISAKSQFFGGSQFNTYRNFKSLSYGPTASISTVIFHIKGIGLGLYGRYYYELTNGIRSSFELPGTPIVMKLNDLDFGLNLSF